MTISYAITCYNEVEETERLLNFLLENKRVEDEIVVVWDDKGPKEMKRLLEDLLTSHSLNFYVVIFNKDFSALKNELKSHCKGDYIFQIDADEMLSMSLIEQLPTILEENSEVEMFRVPRVNTVEGLTQEHVQQWGWNVNEEGWVNWPDYQDRILKNSDHIMWQRAVHEIIIGYKTAANLPAHPSFALIHEKTIQKQEIQNKLYESI